MADARRPAARPQPRPRPGGSGVGRARPRKKPGATGSSAAQGKPTGRATLTTRAAILACVVSALALLLAIPLKTYLGQHNQIDSLQQTQALQEKRIDALQKSVKQYDDPAYITQQARARLHLIAPGETDYVVVPSAAKAPPPAVRAAPAVVVPGTSADPWWTRLWASAAQADSK